MPALREWAALIGAIAAGVFAGGALLRLAGLA